MTQQSLLQREVLCFTIYGQPASKANSRKIVDLPNGKGGKRKASIKSEQARAFEADALRQIPAMARKRLAGPIRFTARIYYLSERSDLDESVVMDVLQDRYIKAPDPKDPTGKKRVRKLVQDGVYRNDRQIKEKHIYHGIDKCRPRVEIRIEEMAP
ncbi:hypothetical protein [Azohydromonas lata]|uniref:hypothetical protein n=1 Tax=Azohydromonas lata TaxID=45677 RepID=UPI00083495C6|nr:hypothetical protein [Azohydromonas lata]